MKYYYIYKTTNLTNGKIYVGQHQVDQKQLDLNYYGSGKLILKAIQKYGKEKFNCEIIEWCEDQETLNLREQYWIKELKAKSIFGNYNMSDGGAVPKLSGELNPMHGKHPVRSEEFKKHLSEVAKGHKPTFTRKRTDAEKEQMSISTRKANLSRDRKIYDDMSKKVTGNKMMIKDGVAIRVYPNDFHKYLALGYKFGGKSRKGKYKNRNSDNNNGKIRINKDKVNKFINPNLLDQYLAEGWSVGGYQKTKN